MLGFDTEAVVIQGLDDPAAGHAAAGAGGDHMLQLSPQRLQALDPSIDGLELTVRDGVRLRAGLLRMVCQAQKLPHRIEREAQFPRVSNETEALGRGLVVEPLVATGSGRFRQ